MLESPRPALIRRGVLALVVGLVALGWPGATVGAFAVLFAVYSFLAAGLDLSLLTAFDADRDGLVIGYVLLTVLAALTGVLAVAWSGGTFALAVAGWALATGVVPIVLAVWRRNGAGAPVRWALGGLVSIALAVSLALRPDIGTLSPVTVFGLFTVVHGITLLTPTASTGDADAQAWSAGLRATDRFVEDIRGG